GPVVTDFQLTLYGGNGGPTAFGNEANRFVVEGVLLFPIATTHAAAIEAATAAVVGAIENILDIVGLATGLPLIDQPVHFTVGYESAVDPHRQAGARRHVEHVTMAEQLFRATLVEDGPRVDLAG